MVRRILLLGILGTGALSAIGCANRPLCHRGHCGGTIFPGRRALIAPVGAPIPAVPIGYGGYEGAPVGIGAPGCASCGSGGGGMPHAAAPVGYHHAPAYAGSGIPHDSMLLHSPTVIPPGAGTPRIEIDPPKAMPGK